MTSGTARAYSQARSKTIVIEYPGSTGDLPDFAQASACCRTGELGVAQAIGDPPTASGVVHERAVTQPQPMAPSGNGSAAGERFNTVILLGARRAALARSPASASNRHASRDG